MSNEKRIILNVTEDLHTRLKAEAAQKGISLGSHCAAILGGGASASPPIEELDLQTLSYLSLIQLREMAAELVSNRPSNWKRQVANVNSEMRRRFKT
jgi:hypothetical protein